MSNIESLLARRAGACPPPSLGLPIMNDREGQAPALRNGEKHCGNRRAGACPLPSLGLPIMNDREGQALALRNGSAAIETGRSLLRERSRGTGPRATEYRKS